MKVIERSLAIQSEKILNLGDFVCQETFEEICGLLERMDYSIDIAPKVTSNVARNFMPSLLADAL